MQIEQNCIVMPYPKLSDSFFFLMRWKWRSEHFIFLYQTESNAVTSLIANLSQHDGNDGVV